MNHAAWGQDFGADEIKVAIEDAGLNANLLEDETKLTNTTIDRLVDGKVVAWFQGRSEWGPRALGNRSILADPRKSETKDIVNNKIKFREPFRPFAPAVLVEAVEEYFDLPQPKLHMPARFMLYVVPVHEDKQDVIPAVSHMGTARIQAVHQETQPLYHRVIEGFGEATGTPVLLNTSFNVQGEPIVNSPQDALKTFINSGIDTLIMGNYVLDKPVDC
jgi:carbamoyltransferase